MIQTAGGTATNLISRTWGDFPDNTGNWTIFFRFKYPSTPSGGKNTSLFNLFDGATDFSAPYFHIGSESDTGDIGIDIFVDGSHEFQSSFTSVTNNTQYWCAVTYNVTTHLCSFYIDGNLEDSGIINLDSITWDSHFILGDGFSGSATSPASLAYCRAWSNILLLAELTTEASSITAAKTTGLLWDCPLQTSIDLTSHNNTLNQLNATGTITTDTTDPLLTITAGPPTNTTPATAITITTDSAYFQDVNTAGVATTVWHVCTAPTGIVELGAEAFGDLVTYAPSISVFEGLANANANIPITSIDHANNLPIQFPVTSGLDYYFKSTRNGAVVASTLQISILNALNLEVPIGSFAINDDALGLPLVLLDRTTGYPIHFVNPFPEGEGGSVLPSGIVAVTDDDGTSGGEFITLADGTIITHTIDLTDVGYDAVSDDQDHIFYTASADAGTHGRILSISDAGIIGSTQFNLPNDGVTGMRALGVNIFPSSIAYYVRSTAGSVPIHRFDLINNIALTNLTTGPAGKSAGKDIIVISDGTIFILFTQVATDLSLIQYNSDGTIAQTISLGANTRTPDNRIARAIEAGNLWIWNRLNTPFGFSQFLRIKISDGSTVETVSGAVQYEGGLFQPSPTNTPIRFGHSESCPFWITRVISFLPNTARSGLYKLTGTSISNPRINHDTIWIDSQAGTSEEVNIPDPFVESYLAGDE